MDHVVPHKRNLVLFWAMWNLQAMCKPCHDRKTATSDGGFGRNANAKNVQIDGEEILDDDDVAF